MGGLLPSPLPSSTIRTLPLTIISFLPFARTHVLCVRLSYPCSTLRSRPAAVLLLFTAVPGKEAAPSVGTSLCPDGQGRTCSSAPCASAPPCVDLAALPPRRPLCCCPGAELPEHQGEEGAMPPLAAPQGPSPWNGGLHASVQLCFMLCNYVQEGRGIHLSGCFLRNVPVFTQS